MNCDRRQLRQCALQLVEDEPRDPLQCRRLKPFDLVQHVMIDYAPGKWIVESKSLKLFLGSFRNHSGFHEDCTLRIGKRVVDAIQPKWLRIGGYWYPRGGIPIDVFWQTGKLPSGLWVPEQGVQPYRGRG